MIPFHQSRSTPPAPDLPRAACRDHPDLPPEAWTDPPATQHPTNNRARAVCAACPERTGLSVPGARRVRDGVLSGSPTHTALIARLRADLNAETCAPRVRADALADEHMREEWPEPIGART